MSDWYTSTQSIAGAKLALRSCGDGVVMNGWRVGGLILGMNEGKIRIRRWQGRAALLRKVLQRHCIHCCCGCGGLDMVPGCNPVGMVSTSGEPQGHHHRRYHIAFRQRRQEQKDQNKGGDHFVGNRRSLTIVEVRGADFMVTRRGYRYLGNG